MIVRENISYKIIVTHKYTRFAAVIIALFDWHILSSETWRPLRIDIFTRVSSFFNTRKFTYDLQATQVCFRYVLNSFGQTGDPYLIVIINSNT